MNVLFVITAQYTFSSQIAQFALAKGLHTKGVNIKLIGAFSNEIKKYLKQNNLPFYEISPQKKIDRNYIISLKKIFEKDTIHIVHFINGKASRSGLIALKKYPAIKAVIYYGSVSLHWYDPSAYLTYLNPRLNAIIGNSNYVYEHVKKQLFGKNKQKAIRIFKGYNSSWFSNTSTFDYSKFGIPKGAIIVCSIGNHRKVKGTRYFLESSSFLTSKKEIHYILIGENTDTPFLQNIAKNSPIAKNIHTLGRRDDVASLLAGCSIYVQTSLSEGFGRAISEAMCVGKPVIMTNAGGCTELIDKNSGIVVPLKDSEALGQAISNLANNNTLRLEMGKNAKKRIDTVYHINETVNDTLSLYKNLLNE